MRHSTTGGRFNALRSFYMLLVTLVFFIIILINVLLYILVKTDLLIETMVVDRKVVLYVIVLLDKGFIYNV